MTTDAPNIALLWTDIETTGLDYDNDLILELAWQITDFNGEPLTGVRSSITIDHSVQPLLEQVLQRYMKANKLVRDMHLANGLWNDVFFNSEATRNGLFEVLDEMLTAVEEVRGDAEVRFAGSSVGFDKRFIETVYGGELPGISHRVYDLSSIRPLMLSQGIDMGEFSAELTDGTHRAAADVERDVTQHRGLMTSLNG